jgi:hypothetical protein
LNRLPCSYKSALILFTLAAALSSPAGVPKGPLLFEDDFSGGTGKWINGDLGDVVDGIRSFELMA